MAKRKWYTPEDREKLRAMWPVNTIDEICNTLGRTKMAIQRQANLMFLPSHWSYPENPIDHIPMEKRRNGKGKPLGVSYKKALPPEQWCKVEAFIWALLERIKAHPGEKISLHFSNHQ